MCGRFSIFDEIEVLEKQFEFEMLGEYIPRYNISPGQEILTVHSNENGDRMGRQLRWGLIPSWAKDEKIGYKMINARAETLHEKVSFKRPLQKQRCLILADGFYEWKKEGKLKRPFRFVMKDNAAFAFAGLWDRWQQNNKIIHSCTIITTEANSITRDIHDRMPVILTLEKQKLWLDRTVSDPRILQSCMLPFDSEKMDKFEVSTLVNTSKNEFPELVEPINSR